MAGNRLGAALPSQYQMKTLLILWTVSTAVAVAAPPSLNAQPLYFKGPGLPASLVLLG